MKLSTKARYGTKAILELAVNYGGKPISIKTISERQNISEYYLEQLFSLLKKSGYIKSIRGAQGGYVLTDDPKNTTVGEIMTVLEGPIEISTCIDTGSCEKLDCCATRLLWQKVKKSIDEVMESITLQDMVDDYKRINLK